MPRKPPRSSSPRLLALSHKIFTRHRTRAAESQRQLFIESLEERAMLAVTVNSDLFDRVEYHLKDDPSARHGVAISNHTTGESILINTQADTVYGTSSTIKIGVLYTLLRKVDADPNLTLDTVVDIGSEYGTTQDRGDLQANQDLSLRELAEHMIRTSDNWATNRLMDFVENRYDFNTDTWGAPGPFPIANQEFAALGLTATRLNRYNTGNSPSAHGLSGPGADYRAGHDNESTPAEMVSLLRQIHENNGLLSTDSYSEFWRILNLNPFPQTTAEYREDPSPDDDGIIAGTGSGNWQNLMTFYTKSGSNPWTGNVGDFTDDPTLGSHFQWSEAGRVQLANGEFVFYAIFADESSSSYAHRLTRASIGYELAVEFADPFITFTPEGAELDDGRVLTVDMANSDLGDDGFEDVIHVELDGNDLVINVNFNEVYRADFREVDHLRIFGSSDDDRLIIDHSGGPIDVAIDFTSIETFIASDRFEVNDTQDQATNLGSEQTTILRDLSIHSPDDVDFFEITAHQTGTLVINARFQHAVGDLDMNVRDAGGNIIAEAFSSSDKETLVIPVIGQQTYFIEVFGFSGDTNTYNLEIENFAAPVPTLVDLAPESDTGVFNNDNITTDTAPTFFIQADLVDYLNSGIALLDQELIDPDGNGDASDATAGGAGVYVSLVNLATGAVAQGFANQVGTAGLLWSFSPAEVTPVGFTLTPGDYFVSAAVQIVSAGIQLNGDLIITTGRTQLSAPLFITIEDDVPPVSFGLPGGGNGLTGSSDGTTRHLTPTFYGQAEAQATVRLYVDVNDNGVIDLGTDVFLGQTTATPYGENPAFTQGYWEITSTVDLNDPVFFPARDGLRRLLVTAEDYVGNVNQVDDGIGDADQVLEIFLDTQGPRVTSVFITDAPDYHLFGIKPNTPPPVGGPTPLVTSLSITGEDFPARVPGFHAPALDATVALAPGHFLLVGDAHGIIAIKSVTYVPDPIVDGQPATGTVVLEFFEPLPDDRFTLTVRDSLIDPAGNPLDGESNAAEPNGNPIFPSGDGQPGGDFVARFTVDSRPEIAVYAGTSIYVDTNGNFVWDSENPDDTNEDITYVLGINSDRIFAGNFARNAGDTADGFSKIAAYGRVNGQWRWLIDTNNNGIPDINIVEQSGLAGIPIAGNFDGNPDNGDEVGLYTGSAWWFDTTHNFQLDTMIPAFVQGGHPFVADFNGDGHVDLGVWRDDTFYFNLTTGTDKSWDTTVDHAFRFGFQGTREIPVAADMNGDGFADVGLWAPDQAGTTPDEISEWYFLVSENNQPIFNRIVYDATLGQYTIPFHPEPFGNDFTAQFGDSAAIPLVGNFDPPVASQSGTPLRDALYQNVVNRFDIDGDGRATGFDVLAIVNELRASGQRTLAAQWTTGIPTNYFDVDGDGRVSGFDLLDLINHLRQPAQSAPAQPAALPQPAASPQPAAMSAPASTKEAALTLALSFTPSESLEQATVPGTAETSDSVAPFWFVTSTNTATLPDSLSLVTDDSRDKTFSADAAEEVFLLAPQEEFSGAEMDTILTEIADDIAAAWHEDEEEESWLAVTLD